jgi:hypothetical protein
VLLLLAKSTREQGALKEEAYTKLIKKDQNNIRNLFLHFEKWLCGLMERDVNRDNVLRACRQEDKTYFGFFQEFAEEWKHNNRQRATNKDNLATYAALMKENWKEWTAGIDFGSRVKQPWTPATNAGRSPDECVDDKKKRKPIEGNTDDEALGEEGTERNPGHKKKKKKALGEEGTERNPGRKNKKKALGEEGTERNPGRKKKKKALGEEDAGLDPGLKKKKKKAMTTSGKELLHMIHDQTPPTETQTGFLQPGPGNSNCPIVMQRVKALKDKCAKLRVIITPGKPQNLQPSDPTGDGHNKMPDSDEHTSLLDLDVDTVDTGDGDAVDTGDESQDEDFFNHW